MISLHGERIEDRWSVEVLLDIAFGPGRFWLSAYRLRAGIEPVDGLSVVAKDEYGSTVGSIRFWPIMIGHAEAILLGPIAVHPTRQGEGVGRGLMLEGLERARIQGWDFVLLVGDRSYYERFGFRRAKGIEFPPPTDPDRVLFLRLAGGEDQRVFGPVTRWQA